MSSPLHAITPAGFVQPRPITLTVTNGTAAKVVVEAYAAAASTATAPAFYGGCTVIDLVASSTDVAKDVLMYTGQVATTQETTNTGIMATGSSSTITRAAGSFITDGWKAGDLLMTFAPDLLAFNAAVDGILGIVTTVVAGTLTVNGTPFAVLTPFATGTRIVRVSQRGRFPVAASAGTNGTTANTRLLGNALDSTAVSTEIKLGADNLLIAGMQANVGALPAYVSIAATVARY